MKRGLCAIVLITLAAAAALHGWALDGHALTGLWRGTLYLEGALLLSALALTLLTRGAQPARLALGCALAAALVFVGAQHFARAARRNATADGPLPNTPGGRPFATVEALRARFGPCFPHHSDGKDEFYELELGTLPPSAHQSEPRWLLTQPYAPLAGVNPGFLVARAYLRMLSVTSSDPRQQFENELKAAGLDPVRFVDALARRISLDEPLLIPIQHPPPAPPTPPAPVPVAVPHIQQPAPPMPPAPPAPPPPAAPEMKPVATATATVRTPAPVSRSDTPTTPAVLKIPEHSSSILSYPAHAVPEIDPAALVHRGAIDIDPADLHEMNYGWEFVWLGHDHPRIGLHTREGAGDYEGQHIEVGDFHGLHFNRQMSELVYDFKVERAGYYTLTALILPEADKCSNYPQAAIDDSQYADLGHNGCVPYVWYDAPWVGGSVDLGVGWHQLHLHFMQDGLTIARYWLTPVRSADVPKGEAAPPSHPPLELLLTRRSMAILKGDRADFGAWVTNNARRSGPATLDADLDPGRGRKHITGHWDIQLDAATPVQEFPLSLELPADLPAREMRVTVTVAAKNPDMKAVRESTVVKPFPALLLGTLERSQDPELSIFDAEYRAPTAHNTNPTGKPSADTWGLYPANAITYYGLYDLNRAFGADSKQGLVFARAYIAVKLDVPKKGNYRFKIMGDDGACVWLDGEHIYSSERKGPPIRYPGTVTHTMDAGQHLLVMHCDQTTGWWQCGVHLRTADDDVCDIEGALLSP